MSVINKMLRDIDEREKAPNEGADQSATIYLPKAAKDDRSKFALGGGALALLVVAVFWFSFQQSEAPAGTNLVVQNDTVPEETIVSAAAPQLLASETEEVPESSNAQAVIAAQSLNPDSTPEDVNSIAASERIDQSSDVADGPSDLGEYVANADPERNDTVIIADERTVTDESKSVALEEGHRNSPEKIATSTSTEQMLSRSEERTTVQEPQEMRVTRNSDAQSSAEVAYREGMRLLQAGNQPAAVEQFQSAINGDIMHHEARLELVVLLFSRGALDDAFRLLAEGIELAPYFNEFRLVEARILQRTGSLEEALNVLNGTSAILPSDADIFIMRASLALELGYYGVAVHSYRQLVAWRPEQGTWWLGLGYALELRGDTGDAIGAYREALRDSRLTAESRRFVFNRLEGLGI